MRRRKALELERQQRLLAAERERQRRAEQMRCNQEIPYKIVRGSDGRLYKVPLPQQEEAQPQERFVRGPDGRLYVLNQPEYRDSESQTSEDSIRQSQSEQSFTTATDGPTESDDEAESASFHSTTPFFKSPTNSTPSKKSAVLERHIRDTPSMLSKVTVIVEDASDSEEEDDISKSIWRNRRPSPGESWMEPVSGVA